MQVADIGADLCGAAHSRERRRAAPQATTNRSIMGRQIYFVPIDLVEDRARTRVVGVAVMTAVYRLGPKPAPGRTLVLLPRGIGLHCSQRKVGSGTGPRGRIRSPDPTPTFCWHQNGGSANSIAEHMLMCMQHFPRSRLSSASTCSSAAVVVISRPHLGAEVPNPSGRDAMASSDARTLATPALSFARPLQISRLSSCV